MNRWWNDEKNNNCFDGTRVKRYHKMHLITFSDWTLHNLFKLYFNLWLLLHDTCFTRSLTTWKLEFRFDTENDCWFVEAEIIRRRKTVFYVNSFFNSIKERRKKILSQKYWWNHSWPSIHVCAWIYTFSFRVLSVFFIFALFIYTLLYS